MLFQDVELSELHLAVPRRWGIPPSSVQLRCVAASRELVILGTSMGMILVHQLHDGRTEKVSLEVRVRRPNRPGVASLRALHCSHFQCSVRLDNQRTFLRRAFSCCDLKRAGQQLVEGKGAALFFFHQYISDVWKLLDFAYYIKISAMPVLIADIFHYRIPKK